MEYLGYLFSIVWETFKFMFAMDTTNPVFVVSALLVFSSIVLGTLFWVLGWRAKK